MVALESPREIPGDEGGPTETEGPKLALPGAGAQPETNSARSSWRPGEGNPYRTFFSTVAATGRAATRDSCGHGEVLYSTSARRRAGARWRASKSASGDGNRRGT
jgi:hypothetical protein